MWLPKGSTTEAVFGRLTSPSIGQPPDVLLNVDVSELESEMEEVLYANDYWVHTKQKASVDRARSDSLTTDQREVQDWRDLSALAFHGASGAHVMRDFLLAGGLIDMGEVETTPKHLSAHGCDQEGWGEKALTDFEDVRGGKQSADGVLWGIRRERGRRPGKDMQVGRIHFDVGDFGGDILLGKTTHRVTGTSGRGERNLCAILHIGAAMAWRSRGQGRSIPTRGSIYRQSMLIRIEEAVQAKGAGKYTGHPKTSHEQRVGSHARDAMKSSHDRDFRGLFRFLGD